MLESKLPLSAQRPEASTVDDHQRINVEILQVSSSTSDARFLDVRVRVRGERRSLLDLVIRIMELLKQSNVGLMSVESNTTMLESVTMHGIMMRLKIEVWILSLKSFKLIKFDYAIFTAWILIHSLHDKILVITLVKNVKIYLFVYLFIYCFWRGNFFFFFLI